MMTMCIEVPYAVTGVGLITVGNSTSTLASAPLKPRPVCWVGVFLPVFKGEVSMIDTYVFDFGTCGIS